MSISSYGKTNTSLARQLIFTAIVFQGFSIVKLIYLVVKLIYTGLVKYVIIIYTNNVCLCQAAAGGKINSTHAESLMFVTH